MLQRDADNALKARAARVVPNGMYGHEAVHILPAGYPQYFARAKGAHLWDADGNRYLDLMCGYGPNLLGYGEPRVQQAALDQMALGDTMTGPSPVMVELAEVMTDMVGHADWAMFCKNGTDANTMALTAARAQTGRKVVVLARGAYHGAAPWCTPLPGGVTPEDRANQITYTYNDVASLEAAVEAAGEDLAAIFASPFKHDAFFAQEVPDPAYAWRARELCDEKGAMLVVDEVRAGFRLARDSSWAELGVDPDLSAWGKCLANGHPISVLLGADSCRQGAASIYATGSFWFSAVPMAAALKTLEIVREEDGIERTVTMGTALRDGLDEIGRRHGLPMIQTGPVQMPLVMFEGDPDLRIGYAFNAAMMQRGVYMHPWHNMFVGAAMTDADIAFVLDAADGALGEIASRQSSLEPHPAIVAMLAAHAAPNND